MAGLDHKRHPIGAAVASSTMAGLLVVLISAAVGRVFRSWLSWQVVVPLLLGAAGTLAALPLVLRMRRREREPKRVFLIVAAFTCKHWVAQLIRDLHENLERRGYDLVLKIPDRDYSGPGQVRLLEGILSRRHEYVGGIIMLNDRDVVRTDLARFCGQAGMPIVFADAEPFDSEDAYPQWTAFTGCDDRDIGEAAGGWVAGYLRRNRVTQPTVLVINGGRYPLREQGFQKQLEVAIPDVQVISDCADFKLTQARKVTAAHLRRLHDDGRKIDAIFCTNDEMALGATDALLHSGITWTADTVVMGVDGTPDARAQIEVDAPQSPLRATVVQDSYKVAETAVTLLERMLRKDTVPKRTSVPVEVLSHD